MTDIQKGGRYPAKPGWRQSATGSTSREAAEAVADRAPRQADLALSVIGERGRASPEEITATLTNRGHKVLLTSIRARCTQLHKQGRLRPSGSFAIGESGRCRTIQWEIVPPAAASAPQPSPEA